MTLNLDLATPRSYLRKPKGLQRASRCTSGPHNLQTRICEENLLMTEVVFCCCCSGKVEQLLLCVDKVNSRVIDLMLLIVCDSSIVNEVLSLE